jgi:hypothetical protein
VFARPLIFYLDVRLSARLKPWTSTALMTAPRYGVYFLCQTNTLESDDVNSVVNSREAALNTVQLQSRTIAFCLMKRSVSQELK